VAAARRLAGVYRPVLARALLARGRVALAGLRDDRGDADFAEATREALAVGDQPTALEAFARRVFAAGTSVYLTAPPDLHAALELIEPMGEHLGDRVAFARALLASNLGSVALARGDRAAALAEFERAHALASTVTGAGGLELTVVDEGLLHVSGDDGERAAIGRELVDTLTRRLGADHPRTLRARITVASIADTSAGALDELDRACGRLVLLYPDLTRPIGDCGYAVLWNAIVRGDTGRAALADTILALGEEATTPAAQDLSRGYRALAGGDRAQAVRILEDVGNRDAGEWWNRLYFADGQAAAAVVLARDGQAGRARHDAALAASIYDAIAASVPGPLLARRRAALAPLLGPPP
ncbi:MAG TPA: hypothetical protein VHE35_23440, partial [Kofleriaceae bacterium]|nr:hypothetical protein [Kofleriaceae bacterium]